MNRARIRRKQSEIQNHRYWQFEKAIDGLFAGTIPPEYVKTRADMEKIISPKRKPL